MGFDDDVDAEMMMMMTMVVMMMMMMRRRTMVMIIIIIIINLIYVEPFDCNGILAALYNHTVHANALHV